MAQAGDQHSTGSNVIPFPPRPQSDPDRYIQVWVRASAWENLGGAARNLQRLEDDAQ